MSVEQRCSNWILGMLWTEAVNYVTYLAAIVIVTRSSIFSQVACTFIIIAMFITSSLLIDFADPRILSGQGAIVIKAVVAFCFFIISNTLSSRSYFFMYIATLFVVLDALHVAAFGAPPTWRDFTQPGVLVFFIAFILTSAIYYFWQSIANTKG